MIVSGSLGILFNPEMVYAVKNPYGGKYCIIAENKDCSITLYEDVLKANVEKIMKRISFQIECQVFKDED
ncbi:MAG: hypothetical protein E6864_00045 [Peptoniphilus harei]|nr:hypothetical protein [Peptoniphilus harei]MDU1662921.1 hypothetical protein [Peptoniphilus harei]